MSPEESLRRYEEQKAKRFSARPPKKSPEEVLAMRKALLEKAQVARRLKLKQRDLIREKVAMNQPITEAERQLLHFRGGNVKKEDMEKNTMAAAAKLLIKPQSVSELRILVEKTAAKHNYNPIESLIEQTRSDGIDEKDKIAIHKALLPFLVPQLAAPKAGKEESEGGVKVTVTQFVFPSKGQKPEEPIHLQRPATVQTTQEDDN